LATEPKILLLDEVLAGLTATEVSQALEMLKGVKERRDLTVIMVEHVMRALMRLSDRVVVLHQGCKIAEGRPEAIAQDPAVIEAYFGAGYDGTA
jgi:branched-chain amino acid transport system ATP-binding protein